MSWTISLKLGLVWVNPYHEELWKSVVCKVSADHITIFICLFSPETIPKWKLFFPLLIGFFSVWWPQPRAPEREKHPRLKPNFKDCGPVLARALLQERKILALRVSFSVTKLRRSLEQPLAARLRILADILLVSQSPHKAWHRLPLIIYDKAIGSIFLAESLSD